MADGPRDGSAVDELRARLRASPAGTVDLGITPIDAALPFSLASIQLEVVTP